MSPSTHPPTYVLFPEVRNSDTGAGRPPVRRYSLTRVHGRPNAPGEGRYDYLKRTHD